MDRDPLHTTCFRQMLKDSDANSVRLPARSPDLNAFVMRFVLSIKSECLYNVIPLGEKHLRVLIKEYMEHYHLERNRLRPVHWKTSDGADRPECLAGIRC